MVSAGVVFSRMDVLKAHMAALMSSLTQHFIHTSFKKKKVFIFLSFNLSFQYF